MESISAFILAAGEGKRMKSMKSKLVHKLCGKPMIDWVYSAVKGAGIQKSVIIVGHLANQVMELMDGKAEFVMQEERLGTGHAVMQAEKYLVDNDGLVLVLYGDTPLVTSETLTRTMEYHRKGGYTATVITAEVDDPTGYGRIIRNSEGGVERIVEHRDASEAERAIKEINSGMYLFSAAELHKALKDIHNDNTQGEYYLTDTLEIMALKGLKVGACRMEDAEEVLGINDRIQLQKLTDILRRRILRRLMLEGVTIMDAGTVLIDESAEIGMDTVIYPGTIIEGLCKIGEACTIGPNSRLVDVKVGDNTSINNSVVLQSSIGNDVQIGPFSYIRPESNIGSKAKIGDFVEIKKSNIGSRTKIPHLAYIGDSDIGDNTNIACGVITVNYNGKTKSRTRIGSNSFVGCNANLVAPVTVNDNSYIAAGSTITEEVPENSLAIARSRQVNKEDWVIKRGMERK